MSNLNKHTSNISTRIPKHRHLFHFFFFPDSSKIPTEQHEEPKQLPYSQSDVNFNIFLDFRLNIESVQRAFEESLWAKWHAVTNLKAALDCGWKIIKYDCHSIAVVWGDHLVGILDEIWSPFCCPIVTFFFISHLSLFSY